MTTLTHFWDPEVAFTLQLITTSAVGALEAGVPAAQIGVGEGVRDWQELASSTGEGGAPALVWDVRGFYFGSADPHGVGGIDAVRLPRKRATFSMLAYDAARLDDLLRRPMPRLNVPAVTAPLPPPRPYAGLLSAFPPKVTRLDQVVPVGTIPQGYVHQEGLPPHPRGEDSVRCRQP